MGSPFFHSKKLYSDLQATWARWAKEEGLQGLAAGMRGRRARLRAHAPPAKSRPPGSSVMWPQNLLGLASLPAPHARRPAHVCRLLGSPGGECDPSHFCRPLRHATCVGPKSQSLETQSSLTRASQREAESSCTGQRDPLYSLELRHRLTHVPRQLIFH